MNKKFTVLLFVVFFAPAALNAQSIAVKSNLLYDASTTINLGFEVGLARQWTLDIPVNYNPWSIDNGMRLRHFGAQPEVRYWFCERFNRTFVGLHAHYAEFNVGIWPDWSFVSANMQNHRYQGYLYGAGISVGYAWILKKRWGIETSFGAGYARIVYDKFPCGECGSVIKSDARNYFGPTKIAVSLIYIIH